MLLTDIDSVVHPGEIELSGLLENSLSAHERSGIEKHLAECDECLAKISSAHEAVRIFKNKRKIGGIMKNVNIYLLMAALSFTLSFFALFSATTGSYDHIGHKMGGRLQDHKDACNDTSGVEKRRRRRGVPHHRKAGFRIQKKILKPTRKPKPDDLGYCEEGA